MLSQNAPFAPIYDSWKAGRREFIKLDPSQARASTEKIVASVLSNPQPPYSIAGGIFDVLRESGGGMNAVRNEEVLQAMDLFEKCEGIDIEPAAGVALAALMKAAPTKQLRPGAAVLLHITGGGAGKRESEKRAFQAPADFEVSLEEIGTEEALQNACGLFSDERVLPAPVRSL
jgi:cysteate synthase